MTDRNVNRLLDKVSLLERANEQQLHLIDKLRRRLAARERAIQALEARLAADPRKEAERLFTGKRNNA